MAVAAVPMNYSSFVNVKYPIYNKLFAASSITCFRAELLVFPICAAAAVLETFRVTNRA